MHYYLHCELVPFSDCFFPLGTREAGGQIAPLTLSSTLEVSTGLMHSGLPTDVIY
jgi:hypothetical protein